MPDNVIGSAQFLISMGLDPSSLIESQAQTKIAAQAMRQAVQDAVERIKVDPNAPAVQFAKSLGVSFEQAATQAEQSSTRIAAATRRMQEAAAQQTAAVFDRYAFDPRAQRFRDTENAQRFVTAQRVQAERQAALAASGIPGQSLQQAQRTTGDFARRLEAQGAIEPTDELSPARQRQQEQLRIRQQQQFAQLTAQREREQQRQAAEQLRAGPNVAIGGQRVALTQDNIEQVRAQAQAFASDPLRQQAAEIQKIANGTKEVERGFNLSGQSVLRMGAGLLGVGLGLNVAAGLAREMHRGIADAVDAEVSLERQARASTAALGEQRTIAAQAAAAQFVQNPATAGTRTEFLQARAQLLPTGQTLGLGDAAQNDLLRQAGELARTWSTTLPQAAAAYEAALRGNTDQLSRYDVVLTDSYGRLKSVGITYQQLVAIIGPTAAAQQVLRDVTAQVATQHENQRGRAHDLADELDRLGRIADETRRRLGNFLGGPAAVVVRTAATILSPDEQQLAQEREQRTRDIVAAQGYRPTTVATGNLVTEAGQVVPANESQRIVAAARAQAQAEQDAAQEAQRAGQATQDAQKQAAQATDQTTDKVKAQIQAWQQLAIETTAHLTRVSELGQQAAQQQQIAQALRGPDFDVGVAREGDITRIGQAQAGMDVIAQRQQRLAYDAGQEVRRQLVDAITTAAEIGPRAVEQATRDLDEFDRRAAAHATQVRAELAQAALAPVRSAVQVESTGLDLAAAGRRVAVADQLAGLTRERLTLEGQIAPIQREQADVQARIALHSQENLSLTRATLEAQRAAQQPLAAQSDLSYRQQRLELQAQQLRVQQIRGTAPADASAQLAAIRGQLREASLDEPGVTLAALDAQHNVEVQQRAQQASQVGQQLGNLPDLARLQALQVDAAPIEAAMRAEQEREAAVQRRLALEDNADAPTRARLTFAVSSADHIAAQANEAAVKAADFAAGLDLGATNAERIANALGRANDILRGAASTAPAGSGVGTHNLREGGDGPPSQYVGVGLNPPAQNPPPVTVAPSATTRSATVQITDTGDVNLSVDASTSREDIAQQVHAIYAERERQTIAKIVNALDNAPEPVNGALVGAG